jgi:hypothetical protein
MLNLIVSYFLLISIHHLTFSLNKPFARILQHKNIRNCGLTAAIVFINTFTTCNIRSSEVISIETPQILLSISAARANAANLPISNGARGDLYGTVQSLIPILKMQLKLQSIKEKLLDGDLQKVRTLLYDQTIPLEEKEFKRYFDEYSEPVSYKQQYLDKNAFLVYYTKGFDGFNRDSIETDDENMSRQKTQYGYRNDAWVGVDDFKAELDYLIEQKAKESSPDLLQSLEDAIKAFEDYVSLASMDQIIEARKKL